MGFLTEGISLQMECLPSCVSWEVLLCVPSPHGWIPLSGFEHGLICTVQTTARIISDVLGDVAFCMVASSIDVLLDMI
jgi:hypothetical protein